MVAVIFIPGKSLMFEPQERNFTVASLFAQGDSLCVYHS